MTCSSRSPSGTRTPTCCCRGARPARAGGPRRRAGHRAHLRDAARPRHLRRDPRRVQRPSPRPDRPAAARGAPARYPSAAGHPGPRTRRRGHLGRPRPGRGRPAGGRLVNAVLRRVATRDLETWIEVVAPPRDAIRSATSRSGTATRAGWRRGWPTRSARTPTASWPRPRPRWPRTASGRGSRCAWCPGWPIPPSSSPGGRRRPGGRRSARTWTAAIRPDRGGPPAPCGVQDEASQLAAIARRPGRGDRAGRPLARHVCRPGRQGPAAGRPGRAARRAPAGRGRAPAPGPAGPRRGAGHRRGGRGGRGRRPARPGGRGVRPGARRRAVLRDRRAAPPPGGPLAQVGRERPGAGRAAAPRCCARRWTRPGRAGWSAT